MMPHILVHVVVVCTPQIVVVDGALIHCLGQHHMEVEDMLPHILVHSVVMGTRHMVAVDGEHLLSLFLVHQIF